MFGRPKKDVEKVSPKNRKNRDVGPLFQAVSASNSRKKHSKNKLEKTMQRNTKKKVKLKIHC
jgi:microcompartment protein CcmL/EutN